MKTRVLCAITLTALLLAVLVPASAGAEGTENALPVCVTGERICYGAYEQPFVVARPR